MRKMKHPYSTLFNIAYIIAGIWILFISDGTLQSYAGIMTILLGLASGAYHWTDKRWAQEADIISIFACFNAMAAYQLSEFAGFSSETDLLLWGSLGISAAIGITHDKWHHQQIGVLAIINLLLLSIRIPSLFIPALSLFLVALAIGRYAEKFDKILPQYDLMHAIWHLLTATAILFLGQ